MGSRTFASVRPLTWTPCKRKVCIVPTTPEPLDAVIGGNVRRLREQHGARQEQIAATARAHGLGWGRSSVANLEAGRVKLSLTEAVLLPTILGRAFDATVTLHQILATDAPIVLTDAITTSAESVMRTLAGRRRPTDAENENAVSVILMGDEFDEANQKAARRLMVPAGAVAHAARQLWGRSMTAERDARAAELTPKRATPRSVQAIRGGVTRKLIDELAEHVEVDEED